MELRRHDDATSYLRYHLIFCAVPVRIHGAEAANVLHEGQGHSLHQGHEPGPEGRGLLPVLVEHAFQHPRFRRCDGEAVRAIQKAILSRIQKYLNTQIVWLVLCPNEIIEDGI